MPNRMLRDWTELTVKMAPYNAGVYAFLFNSKILYIGSTWCLRNRCSNHIIKRFIKKEYGSIQIYYRVVDDYIKVEKELILNYRPLFNKQYLIKPIKKNGKKS